MITKSPWRSDRWPAWRSHVDRARRSLPLPGRPGSLQPDPPAQLRIDDGADEDEHEPDRREPRPAEHPGVACSVALEVHAHLQEQPEHAHDDVRTGEPQPILGERARNRGRHHQGHRRRCQRDDPDLGMGGVGWIERPRELRPCPPDQPAEDDRAEDALERQVMCGVDRELGDGEDEDEIEEELDERDRLGICRANAARARRCRVLHRLSMKAGSPRLPAQLPAWACRPGRVTPRCQPSALRTAR